MVYGGMVAPSTINHMPSAISHQPSAIIRRAALREERLGSAPDFEWHRRHLVAPRDGHRAALVGHVDESPRELLDRMRQRLELHRRADDVLVARVEVGAPQR